MMERFTPDIVKSQAFVDNGERLFAVYASDRPPNWSCDSRTREFAVLTAWLDETLKSLCNDKDRITQLWKFNRLSRSFDLYDSACECVNDAIDGNVEQNRVPLRRWG